MIVQPLKSHDPQVIGRYQVLGLLGSGGMGRVLLGVGPDGRFVAIKQIHSHLLDEPEYRARFRREVSASTRVSGAFTAPVIDFDVDTRIPWLASVFVVGVPLDQAVRDYGPLPVPAIRVLAAGLAAAMADIHRSGLVHRDLKPGNVLLTADGPRVIDFGIALLTEHPSGLTESGSTLGSPAYMSPEQVLAEPVSYASDMFSLGSLLVMAATGSSPFTAGSLAYTLFNIAHTAPNLDLLAPELQGLIGPCLHKDPRARPTPAQFLGQIGWLPEQSMPWPASIHGAIDQQTRELATLAANPDATFVVSRSGSATTHPAGFASGVSTRKRVARRAALAAAVVLMLIAAGLAWVRIGSDSTQAETTVPMLTILREADTCAWLRQALGGSVPAETGWPTDVSEWKLSTDTKWSCKAEAAGKELKVEAGKAVRGIDPTGKEIDGRPILGIGGPYCARAADFSDAGEGWGVFVSSAKDMCGVVDHVFTRLMAARDSIPRLTDPTSLATVDPCDLVSWDSLNDIIGPLPKNPAEFDAHVCTWQGTERISITLYRGTNFSIDRSIDLEDGKRLDVAQRDSICSMFYTHQRDPREVMEISVSGGKDTEQHCATSESLMRTVIPKLPKPN